MQTDEKTQDQDLDEALNEALRATIATLQQLLDSTHEDEVRLKAARTLYRVVQHFQPRAPMPRTMPGAPSAQARPGTYEANEDAVDHLISNLIESEPEAEQEEIVKRPAPPPPPKPAVAEKARPRPKPSVIDEVSEPRVHPRYLVTLGSLAAALLLFVLWNWLTGVSVPSPESLAKSALSGGDTEERTKAAGTLILLKSPTVVKALRQLAAESQDPSVKVIALRGLIDRGDTTSISLCLDAMDSPQQAVREVGYAGSKKMLDVTAEKENELGYAPDGPPDQRARATQQLRDQYNGIVEARKKHRQEYGEASGKK